MDSDVTIEKLKAALGKKVEVLAFNVSYTGVLKKVDVEEGLVRVEDKEDYVILEIERIEALHLCMGMD